MLTESRVNQAVHSPSLLNENAFDRLSGDRVSETEILDLASRWTELATLPATVADTVCPVARATKRAQRAVPSVTVTPGSAPNWSATVFHNDPPSLGLRKSAFTTSDATVFLGMAREVPKRTVFGPMSEPSASFEPLPS